MKKKKDLYTDLNCQYVKLTEFSEEGSYIKELITWENQSRITTGTTAVVHGLPFVLFQRRLCLTKNNSLTKQGVMDLGWNLLDINNIGQS